MNRTSSPTAILSCQQKPPRTSTADDGGQVDIEALFEYLVNAATGDERREWRREIIVGCLPLADRIARRFAGRGEPSDDLTQVARIGLIKAIDRYDPAKGSFRPFAVIVISGEVRRYFRDTTWGMHVTRGIKDTHRRVRAASEPLSQRLGRAPTARELATELDVAREDISMSMDATYAYRPASLDARAWGCADHGMESRHGADDHRFNAVEDAVTVARSITELSDRQQLIVKMRFYEHLTQAEIAQYFGVSQVHVSRLLAAALARLRAQLSDASTERKMSA